MFIRPWLEALKSRLVPGNRLNKRRISDHMPVQSQVESLEDKSLLSAFDLVTVIPNQGVFLNDNAVLHEAPKEVTLRFSPGQTITQASLSAVTVVRAGVDGIFDNPATPALESSDDANVPVGYIGLGEQPNEVIVRFAQSLVDDKYQIRIEGSGANSIASVTGDPFNGGANKVFNLDLDLGAQVEAVVPQPIIRSAVFTSTGLNNLTDGDVVAITSGANTYRFEINLLPNNVTVPGNIRVDVPAGSTAPEIATALVTAINANTGGQMTASNGATSTVTIMGAAFEPVVAFTTTNPSAFSRSNGTLSQKSDTVVVYFNQDQLNATSANDPKFYQLIDTVTSAVSLPASVNYTWNPVNGLSVAVLTFAAPLANSTYSLKIGASTEPNNTGATAVQAGTVFSSQDFVTNSYLGDGSAGSADSSDVDLYQVNTAHDGGNITVSLTPNAAMNGVITLFGSTIVRDGNGKQIGTQIGSQIGASVNANGLGGVETLTFAAAAALPADLEGVTYYVRVSSSSGTGSYQLRIQSDVASGNSDDNSSFGTATNLGDLGTSGLSAAAQIEAQGAFVTMPQLPGGSDEPGHRDLPSGAFIGSSSPEVGHSTGIDGAPAPPAPTVEQTYSFPLQYDASAAGLGTLQNQITEKQKEIIRQIFAIYANEVGIQFREVASGGTQQIVVGDIRANAPQLAAGAAGGISGSPLIINSIFYANDNTFGGGFTTTAFHEIGHNLGLGHSYDVPSIQGGGVSGENVFTGDNDLIHLLRLLPNNSSDIDLYKFNITQAGTLSAQTVAERLGVTNLLDSELTLYKEDSAGVRTVVARNDDFFSKDAGMEIGVTPGTYYIGVTSSGNDNFDPTISNSGFGGRSQGAYQLKLDFKPTAAASSGLVDTTGQYLDGDHDGLAGGENVFSFSVAPTIVVDKLAPNGGTGTVAAPYNTISAGLAAAAVAPPGAIVRIVGNGGADGNAATLADNIPYAIGKDYNVAQTPLADGVTFQVPKGVTVMIDAGALLKIHAQTIDVGTSSAGIDRSHGALQVLGTPVNNVTFTSWRDDASGTIDDGTNGIAAVADWGGIVFRQDSDTVSATDNIAGGVFLNSVNHATLQYGGGKVSVDGNQAVVYSVLDLETSRPTLTNNIIRNNADAAISANPDSFKADDGRIGPDIHGNLITQNSTNGLFIRVQTPLGGAFETLNVIARFDDTDITHVITQSLILNGRPAGALSNPVSARLQIDPGLVVKLSGARIETAIGSSNLIAEGTAANPIHFTSQQDDSYGAGGTFDLKNDGNTAPTPGNWSGIFVGQASTASLDHVSVTYAGGTSEISGNTDNFNPIEVYQGNLRLTNSLFQNNLGGQASTTRNGRGGNDSSTIFVRGAQPVIVNNTFQNNQGNVISINANSMQSVVMPDRGRSTGGVDDFEQFDDNYGPLVRLNKFANSATFNLGSTLGMNIRPEELTIESIWDDTDIAHVVRGTITSSEFHTYGGLTLQSSPTGSLVVKLQGSNNAGFVATGDPLDISNRIGGTVDVIGQPNFPVILTSLSDDSVSAGLQPNGFPQFDTNGDDRLGVAESSPNPGDWNSLSFDQYSNDTNVALVNETEPALNHGNDINGTVASPQALGNLAPNLNSGDENRRLGYEVHGFISTDSPGDVDVYSFTANAGTEVWIDTDFTSQRLDVMLELLDSAGTVLARSLNSQSESAGLTSLAGTLLNTVNGQPGGPGNSDLNTLVKDPTLGTDFYTSNFHDAGFRAVLPGTAGSPITYFVRVRSQPVAGQEAAAIPTGGNGLTSGTYQLQVRLKQVDEIPGSTVRYADIRYATNGIELHGLPAHSPLMGEGAEGTGDNNSGNGGQNLGPLLQTDRNTLSVSGTLSSATDIDFYQFSVDYSQVQVISGGSDGQKFFPTMFDIDYADGLTRPDTSIAVFNSVNNAIGNLIYIGRASDIADDQPRPGEGQDLTDLLRASFGNRDPLIGSVNLPAGVSGASETGGINTNPPAAGLTTYYVAVFSNGQIPTALTAVYNSGASGATQLVRLEPIDSVQRVVEDHIGTTGYTSQGVNVAPTNGPLFNVGSTIALDTNIRPFTLSDVNLFVTTSSSLFVVDPYNGTTEINYADYGNTTYQDIDMRSDGLLYGVRSAPGAPQAGALVQLDTGTGGELSAQSDGITDVDGDGATQRFQSNGAASTALAFRRSGVAAFDTVYYATANADDYPDSAGVGGASKLYRANGGNGSAAWSGNNFGATGIVTDFAGTVTTQTTGLQFLNGTLWGVSAGNQLYRVSQQNSIPGDGGTNVGNPDAANPAVNAALTPRLVFGTVLNFAAILPAGSGTFAGLTDAPQNLQNSAYANFLFIITNTGRIFCVDPNAASAATALQSVFDNNNDGVLENFIDTNVGSATGLAFSPVDYNLWHPTQLRSSDLGHGITSTTGTVANPNITVDNSRTPSATSTGGVQFGNEFSNSTSEANGGASMYFGIENYNPGSTTNYYQYDSGGQYGVESSVSQQDLTNGASTIHNNYNVPGGTSGSLVTNSFSLEGYTASDKPTLYFNYFLSTEGANGKFSSQMRDSARVFVSVDNGLTWQLAATNNSALSDPLFEDAELPAYSSADRAASFKVNQGVQELFDTGSWRQARIDLNDYVGNTQVKLRFDFSTSGRSGSVIDPLTGLSYPSDDSSNPTYQDDTVRDGVFNGTSNSPLSAQNNTAEGFYLDDIIVGFAGRGEMVTSSSGQGSGFTNLESNPFAQGGGNAVTQLTRDPDPTATPQLLSGDYQLEIRRGEQFATMVNPVKSDVLITTPLDINDRLTNGQTVMVGNNVQAGNTVTIYDGLITRTFEFTTGGAPAVGNIGVSITGLNPITQKGIIASRLATQITNTFSSRNTVIAKAVGASVNSDRVDIFDAVTVTAIGTGGVNPTLPVQVEDNDTLATATNTGITGASIGTFTGNGQIGNGSNGTRDVDLYRVDLNAGQSFQVDIDLPGLTGDSILRIFNAAGTQLAVSDDDIGPAPEFRSLESFISFIAPLTGTYYVGISGYSNFSYNPTIANSGTQSSTTFSYTINMTATAASSTVAMTVDSYVRKGDDNLVRTQGQFIVENNTILYAGNDGILINDNDRFGTVPHPGAALNLPVQNTQRLVTGIYIQNNVIARFATNGIDITGDPNVNLGAAVVPFVKIVNNTIYGNDIATTPASAKADIVFLIDNSNSMAPDIATLVAQLLTFDTSLQSANIDANYGLVQFPRPSTTAPQQTQDIVDFATFTAPGSPFRTISITGSIENGSQAILEGLNDFDPSTTFNFRPGARQVLVMLTDEDDDSTAAQQVQAATDLANNNALFYAIARLRAGTTRADYGTLATGSGGALLDLLQFENDTANFITALTSSLIGAIGGAGATGVGINVANNAGPTIMNNVVVNTTVGIQIDPSSSGLTEVEANLFQNNTSDGTLGNNALAGADTSGQPMFVNATANNFYPAPTSPIIDSARNNFNDRAGYTAVTGPLGIPPSPILAPNDDRFGQLRLDDGNQPSPANQPGLGANPFQDRGAIERADFTGGIILPSSPQDNDGAGVDYDPASNTIWVDAANPLSHLDILTELKLQLIDNGVGIDDDRVDADGSDFLLLRNGVPLVQGQDYFFTYNRNTNEAIFTSVSTFPLDSRYQIVVNAAGITDFAGNVLLNNQATTITPSNPLITAPFDDSLLYFNYVFTDGKNDGPVTSLNGVPAPVAPLTAPQVVINEDSSATFSAGASGLITVSDQDAFLASDGDPNGGVESGRIRVTVSIPNGFGTLALGPNVPSGLGVTLTGAPVFQIVLNGRIDDINTALDGLIFTPPADFPTALPAQTVNITVLTEDLGKFGPPAPGNTIPQATTTIIPVLVNPVNDAPTFNITTPTPITILEDKTVATQIDLTGIDAGGGETQSLRITATSGNPALIPDSNILVGYPNTLLPVAQQSTGNIQFTALPDHFGTAVLTITLTDAGLDGVFGNADDLSFSRNVTVNVTPVNDAPLITPTTNSTVLEDVITQTIVLTGISTGNLEFPGQTLTLTAASSDPTVIPDPVITYVQGASTATLTYKPNANANGTVTITITAADDGGVQNGGVDTTLSSFTITVIPVNDPPTVNVPPTLTINEDAVTNPQTILLTGISAGPLEPLQSITSITVTSNNQTLIPDANIVKGILNSGTLPLTITPVANQFGIATITVTITDDGLNGGANGDINIVTKTFTINVLSVNDSPSFDVVPPQTILEDAAPQTINLTNILPGPANESSQTLVLSAVSLTPGLIGTPIVTGQNAITYTPVANANGQATIRVTLKDNGGTLNGGVDTYVQDIVINITPVNDAPTLDAIANQPTSGLLLEDAGQQTINLSGIAVGAANENGQTLTVTGAITSGNPNLAGNFIGSTVSANGTATLKYTPTPNEFGTAVITVTITDSGANGGANGDVNFTTRTFTLTITPVNDAPKITAIPNQIVNEDAGQQIISLSGMSVGFANEAPPQTLSFTLLSDNPALIPNDASHLSVNYTQGSPTGQLLYTSVPNGFGVANITLTIKDTGGTANGGVDTTVLTFRVTVNQVPDTPGTILLSNNSVYENRPAGTVVGLLSTLDVDLPDDNFIYSIVGGTGLGVFQINGNQLQTAQPLNFESTPSYTVTLRTTDRFGLFLDQQYTVAVLNLNDAPTMDVINNVSFNEDPATPFVVNLTGISAGAGESQTVIITATSDNPGLFNDPLPVNYVSPSSTGTLLLSPKLNANGTALVTITVQDSGGTANGGIDTITRTFLVTVNAVNDNPSDIGLSNNTIQEIVAGTNLPAHVLVGQLTSTDPDNPKSGDTFSYSLVSGAGSSDNDKFRIVNDQLFAEGPIDFDLQPDYTIRIQTKDNGTPNQSFEKVFTIHSTNLNEPATGISTAANPISGIINSIPENQPALSVVGTLVAADPDAGDSSTFSLVSGVGGDNNPLFSIVNGQLVANVTFNYEVKTSYTVRIRAVDSQGLTFETPVIINVTNVNETPLVINLSNSTVPEDISVGTNVGTLSTIDVDVPENFTYTLVTGAGSTDNARFTINGDKLVVATPLNYEERPGHSYSVRVRVTDIGGAFIEKTFTINVTDVNEAPVDFTLSPATINENLPVGSTVGTLTPADPDLQDTYTFLFVNGAGSDDNAAFEFNGNKLVSAQSFDFETKPSYTVRIRATDAAGHSIERQFTIRIVDKKDPPVIVLSSTTLTTSGHKAVVVDPNATITDIDSPNFNGGKLKVFIQSGEQTGDTLGFKNEPRSGMSLKSARGKTVLLLGKQQIATISGGVRGIPLEIQFGAGVSQEIFQRVIRQITFRGKPFAAPRQIGMQAFDELGLASKVALRNITVN